MKKLAIVHPAYWEQALGGAELQISYLCEFAQYKGWEVHYIYEEKKTLIENLKNISLHPIIPIIRRNTLGFRFSLSQDNITNDLIKINPDVVYTRCAFSWSGIAAKYAKDYNKKHIWAIASDDDPIAYKLRIKDLIKPLNIFEKYWIKYAIKNASVIICQNRIQQKLLYNLHHRESIHISQMAPEEEKIIHKDYSKLKIIWIGNLKPIKRPEIFIRLSNYFTNREVAFTMIGKPDSKYNSMIEEARNLQFLGSIPNKSVNELLCESHLLINTSTSEGFSNTFVQAWLRKVPVISMNSNPDEILTKQDIGRICNTEEQLKQTVEEILSNLGILEQMGERAHKYATNNHSIQFLLPHIFKLLESN